MQDWAHSSRQPRSQRPNIVEMLRTRNSWPLPPPDRNRHTTDCFAPQQVFQSNRGNLLVIPVTKSGQWLISQVEPAEAVDAARRSRHCSNVVKRQFVIPPTTPSL